MKSYTPTESFFRTATGTPQVAIGNVKKNVTSITNLYAEAKNKKVSLIVFPELCLTGYSAGDLFLTPKLQRDAIDGLRELMHLTQNTETAMIVGMPYVWGNALYNCAIFIAKGSIKGIVPKINLPNYKEFYEKRWFQSWSQPTTSVDLLNQTVSMGTDLIFDCDGARIGIEICEDAWVTNQPSRTLINSGAHIICNPSASPEIATKSDYRRQLISQTSASQVGGYVYAGADPSESTMDIVMGGHCLITQMGRILAERPPFTESDRVLVADIDIESISKERLHDNNFHNHASTIPIKTHIKRMQKDLITTYDPSPFLPKGPSDTIAKRLDEILTIQAYGLKKRLESSGAERVVLGLSGGLDSTLALLVALRTCHIMKRSPKQSILALTMPSHASSHRTQNNAEKLAHALTIEHIVIPIAELAHNQLQALGRDPYMQDITYENTQARLRTALLFNTANARKGIVLGTGDLSEIALGWCTYNGDHMSSYNVNSSIPKTLVRSLVQHASQSLVSPKARALLKDIIDTPISPELTTTNAGSISQKTEDLIGPYELHDFFLYHFIRWSSRPEKIAFLAQHAFKGVYTHEDIHTWLTVFLKRFTANQWKRSVMTDGPKVGSVSLSPRGDWRMPSDVDADVLL